MASTNADGLRQVQQLRPDVTLVDVNLGEESGFDLAETLQDIDDWSPVPVILISTHAEPDLADLIETSPAIGFLAKSALSAGAITAALDRLDHSRVSRPADRRPLQNYLPFNNLRSPSQGGSPL